MTDMVHTSNQSQNSKVLTIGLPTYNRAFLLDTFFESLFENLDSCASQVAVLVSDNASTDDSARICQKWIERLAGKLDITYHRQDTNVGVSKNLVSLLAQTKTPYFMFLGDDDRLYRDGFRNAMKVLTGPVRPSAIVQSNWSGHARSPISGWVGAGAAHELFYEFGNAWGGIIDAPAAQIVLQQPGLREKIEAIVWPQCVLGFLAMLALDPKRQVYFFPEEIGGQATKETLAINTSGYWVRSLHDLLTAACIVDSESGNSYARHAVLAIGNHGLRVHLKGLLISTLRESSPPQIHSIVKVLRRQYGIRGLAAALLVKALCSPSIARSFAILFCVVVRRMSPTQASERLNEFREAFSMEVKGHREAQKRLGDWF